MGCCVREATATQDGIRWIVCGLAAIVGCSSGTQRPFKPSEPGVHGHAYYGSNYGRGILIPGGQVGRPYTLRPGGFCSKGGWTFEKVEVFAGSLPPGLAFDSQYNIAGRPTRAGTWHVTVKFVDVQCCGNNFGDLTHPVTIVVD